MREIYVVLVLWFSGAMLYGQTAAKKVPKAKLPFVERKVYINPKSGFVRGTQSFPKDRDTAVACLIIPGSGPVDRDGNNGNILQTNMYRMLSDSLASHGFAVIRYDKRGVADSREPDFVEFNVTFEDYVKDAARWIKEMKQNKRYSKIVVIGHSEGSLIGMLCADSSHADAFISLAGPAKSADTLILNQLKNQQLTLYEEAVRITRRLRAGERVDTISPILQAVYRPQIQNYLRSWFKYRPATVIQSMKIPVLIVQGTTDIQVTPGEAQELKAAKPDAELLIVNGMNHILKTAPSDRGMNLATYTKKEIPLNSGLIPGLVAFLRKLEKPN